MNFILLILIGVLIGGVFGLITKKPKKKDNKEV